MRWLSILLSLFLLTGCGSLLEREYSVVEPHSSKFWEGEAADTLRAENYQDVVNDLLILIGQHKESASLRLYNMGEELEIAELLDRAIIEVRQETPMGAFAAEYITLSHEKQRGRTDVQVRIGYRRSAEQVQSVLSATSVEALSSLLGLALDQGQSELAVRFGYWDEKSWPLAVEAVQNLRESRGLLDTPPWVVERYPAEGPVGLLEFHLSPEAAQAAQAGADTGEGSAPQEDTGLRPALVDPEGAVLATVSLPPEQLVQTSEKVF